MKKIQIERYFELKDHVTFCGSKPDNFFLQDLKTGELFEITNDIFIFLKNFIGRKKISELMLDEKDFVMKLLNMNLLKLISTPPKEVQVIKFPQGPDLQNVIFAYCVIS